MNKYTYKYSMRQKTMRNIDYVDDGDDMEVGQETLWLWMQTSM